MKRKNFNIAIVTVLTICFFVIITLNNNGQKLSPKPIGTFVYKTYSSEVKDPKWAIKKADLIIIGDMIDKENSVRGKNQVNGSDAIYVDNNIKITKIIKNIQIANINIGDIITVRNLGGTTSDYKFEIDSDLLLPDKGSLLLCLVDGAKIPSIPTSNDKHYYAIVGGIHGAFNLSTDGLAKRSIVKDSYKLDHLLTLSEGLNP